MNNITVKIFPALNGDCFLITTGETNILIDGGYVNTYNEFLKPNLIEMASKGEKLSLLVVSHIDADHISGIIKFIEENETEKIIPVQNIWHNAFRHIQQDEQIDTTIKEEKIFNDIKREELSGSATNVSAKQGSSLASILLKYKYQWNTQFHGNAVSLDHKNSITVGEFTVNLLSPNQTKLESLQKYWRKELYKNGYLDTSHTDGFWDDAFEFLLAQDKEELKYKSKTISYKNNIDFDKLKGGPFTPDTSPTNGSSISLILQVGDKKMLFLGDSHSDLVESELKKHLSTKGFPIYFDLVKLSHHGSFSNNSPGLLELIDSDKWIISSNGKIHNHPDIETLAWILTKDNKIKRNIFFNYPLAICQELSNSELKEKYNYEIIFPETEEPIELSL
jgi:beta-lactamase superfamily II metal-dependent hydrolase